MTSFSILSDTTLKFLLQYNVVLLQAATLHVSLTVVFPFFFIVELALQVYNKTGGAHMPMHLITVGAGG